MKPFNYKDRLHELRAELDTEVADYVFRAKDKSYAEIAELFSTSVGNVKRIARNAGIVRGKGWRPKR